MYYTYIFSVFSSSYLVATKNAFHQGNIHTTNLPSLATAVDSEGLLCFFRAMGGLGQLQGHVQVRFAFW